MGRNIINYMVSSKFCKRLAASLLKSGRKRIKINLSEKKEFSNAISRKAISRLIENGSITLRPINIHARSKTRRYAEEKSRGLHKGIGKRHGTREARFPNKLLWIRHMRILRRLLKKYRKLKKIDKSLYHRFYVKCKGDIYKSKRDLIDKIQNEKKIRKRRNASVSVLKTNKQSFNSIVAKEINLRITSKNW